MDVDQLVVTQMSFDESQWLWDYSLSLDREFCYGDPEGFWAADEAGFFVGKLNGKIISSVAYLKYSKTFTFVGFYRVARAHRRQGHGLKTFKKAAEMSLPPPSGDYSTTAALIAAVELEPIYERSGYKRGWLLHYKTFNLRSVANIDCFPNDFTILPVSRFSDLEQIVEYDSKCFFVKRREFLKKWMLSEEGSGSGREAFVAQDSNGEIVGLIVARQPISDNVPAYQVGPFYANSTYIATCLLQHVCTILIDKKLKREKIGIVVPEINSHALDLADKLNGITEYSSLYMFTNPPPASSHELVYGIASQAVG